MTILYADDDDEDQEFFSEIIQAIDPGIKILRAANGLETIKVLSGREAPTIIFLDFNMPFLNGHQALEEIRKEEKYKNTMVVIFSANLYEFNQAGSFLNVRYARKPNTIREGIEALKAIIQEGTNK